MRVLATYSIKGGVGKTAAAVNLAYLASRDGARTLLWDLDPQGAATWLFRVKPRVKGGGSALVRGRRDLGDAIKGTDFDGLDLLPADFSYRHLDLELDGAKKPRARLARLLAPLRHEYDVVLLDCPPSISLVSESVFRAAATLLVPLVPTTLSLRTLDQLHAFLDGGRAQGPAVLAFFSMADRRKRLHREVMATLPGARPGVLQSAVPSSTEVERMGLHRAPVPVFAPRSRAAAAYEELWREVQGAG
ncbi:MAG TPA: ParA family protein [Acidimicrobiales bacterium]